MTKRIFKAIILVASAVLLLSFLIMMDVLYGSFSTIQLRQLKSQLATAAYGVENGGTAWLEGLDARDYRLTLVDADGTVLYDSAVDAAGMENHADRAEIAEALASGSGESERMSATLTEKTLYRATRLSNGTVLRISVTQNSAFALVLGMITPVLIVLCTAIVLAAILANSIAKRIVRPLNNLDLENPLDNDTYDELSPLLNRIALQHSEIKRQVSALKRRQDEFAAITSSMNEGLVLLNESGSIVSINPAARVLFNAGESCIGSDFLTVERGRDVQQAISSALQSGRGEAAIVRNSRQYALDASRIVSEGKTAGVALIAFDVTYRAQADQMRREFTANVSHELKTPLQSIMGAAELMENGIVKPEDMPRFTGRIRSEAGRLVTLIDDIIRLSQLDEGAELTPEPVDILAVANDAASQLEDAAAAKNVALYVQGEAVTVSGVRRLLHEIAYNLIDNAIKYNREGGSVTVTTAREGGKAMLTVSDTGTGIPIEHQSRVFERFYRVDKSHSKATGGTGLGLSIVKHAVEALNGDITLKSKPGEGTEMCVVLPIQE